MKLNFYATFRQIAGSKCVEIDLPQPSTMQMLIDALREAYPRLADALLDESGQLRPHVHIMINGHHVQLLEGGLNATLNPTDRIDLFPPIAGG